MFWLMQATIHEAKTYLSRLIQKAVDGEEVIISKRDRPLVKLVPISDGALPLRFGALADVVISMDDTNDAIALAGQLVSAGIVPAKAASDSLHIAVASIHEIDYLVTWNFKHIANPFLRDRLRNAVNQAGFELPVMCSPEELLQNDEDN